MREMGHPAAISGLFVIREGVDVERPERNFRDLSNPVNISASGERMQFQGHNHRLVLSVDREFPLLTGRLQKILDLP